MENTNITARMTKETMWQAIEALRLTIEELKARESKSGYNHLEIEVLDMVHGVNVEMYNSEIYHFTFTTGQGYVLFHCNELLQKLEKLDEEFHKALENAINL